MSTLAYGMMTERRKAAPPGTSADARKADPSKPAAGRPGVTMWADAAAALVPAEVLAAQAFLLGVVTEEKHVPRLSSDPVTVITEPGAAKLMFWGLLVASLLLYVYANLGRWRNADFVRMLIPPAAFVLWSSLQPASALQAVVDWNEAKRYVVGVVGVLIVGGAARALATQADRAQPR